MKTLDDLRKEIDLLDEEILKIIAKRMDIVREIGNLKKENNLEPLDQERWHNVLDRIKKAAKDHNIPSELVEKVYEQIHNASLKMQEKI